MSSEDGKKHVTDSFNDVGSTVKSADGLQVLFCSVHLLVNNIDIYLLGELLSSGIH